MKPGFVAKLILFLAATASATLGAESFDRSISLLLKKYCVTCHSTAEQAGELDLERFSSLEQVQQEAEVWERVQEQLALGEMPPQDAPPLSIGQRRLLSDWVQTTLNEIALSHAGDPGPVVLRRLSNHEYTYSIQDLTGVAALNPAREFPVDGAAGEGFTNVGAALVMSPALLSKYLDAARELSGHLVLLEDGVRFSASQSAPDWTAEALTNLREFYARYTESTEVLSDVNGTGFVKSEAGSIPLARYLGALQQRGDRAGLSAGYLNRLEQRLQSAEPSLLFDPLREKYRKGQLTATDIEVWRNVLWRFNPVGHIGRPNGPKSWQEPVNPFVSQQEFRMALPAGQDAKLYLTARGVGEDDAATGVDWENPRLVAPSRPDIPLSNPRALVNHLAAHRAQLLADGAACLEALAAGNDDAPPESLPVWRDYLALNEAALTSRLTTPVDGASGYPFLKAWRDEQEPDLAVWSNPSDADVHFPGLLKAHSIAVHPAPQRDVVIAWKSPVASARINVAGRVQHAHPACGNGVSWTLEVRRGATVEQLASGNLDQAQGVVVGPFENVDVRADQSVALRIGSRDRNHFCDLTEVQLTISDGEQVWDLAGDASPNLLAGNPNGTWSFSSQSASSESSNPFPAPVVEWRRSPSSENAARVMAHFQQDFPLTHPLLASALRSFQASTQSTPLTGLAPCVLEIEIPAALSTGAEFVVTGRLAAPDVGSLQLEVLSERPAATRTELNADLPILVGEASPRRRQLEAAFDEFRELFPAALCYARIVPIDEAVTLNLYFREDAQLQRLILSAGEIGELDRLWRELLFVSEAPLKQLDAFEQIYQFATQDRGDLVVEFETMREPITRAANDFRERQQRADVAQREAVLALASRAWRRPLTAEEAVALRAMPPRLMLMRILASPSFLYRSETPGVETGPVNDWELATRLSYFLWSSLPDDVLRESAAAGRLRDPDELAQQARRMLRDHRIRRLALEFGCQSLHVRDLATLDEKSERHFPNFKPLREAMLEEVTQFYMDLFQNDRSVLTLLDADHTFLNGPLAAHYEIPFEGDGWRRVDGLRDHNRGGVLGFSAVLAKQSGASRTSAILRGAWVSEVLLGDKIPNPPKGVPTLPEEPPAGLTERQLIERHSSDARCASCHRRIDPFGFALEGFDAIGRARLADTKAVVFDGATVEGMAGLRDYLAHQRRDDFVRQFNRKLLGYALGRSVQLSDQPLLESMTLSEGAHVADLVERIVRSPQFREIRGVESLAGQPRKSTQK